MLLDIEDPQVVKSFVRCADAMTTGHHAIVGKRRVLLKPRA